MSKGTSKYPYAFKSIYDTPTYEIFDILWKDELLAKVTLRLHNKTASVRQYTNNLFKRPFPKEDEKVTFKDVLDFLEWRCVPKSRDGIDEILDYLGLLYYNPLMIVKETHGLILEDFMWVRFEGEMVVYDDIKIRGSEGYTRRLSEDKFFEQG